MSIDNTKPQREQILELYFKITLLETQISEFNKHCDKNYERFDEISKTLFKLKEDLIIIQNEFLIKRKTCDTITTEMENLKKDINKDINDIKIELPEMRFIKKIVLGMIAFILTAFIGLVWNNLIINPERRTNQNIEELVKKLSQEYIKTK